MRSVVGGIIDISVNPYSPLEVQSGQTGVDDAFVAKVRQKPEHRNGVSWEDYLLKMDAAGVEHSLVIATRGGDMRVKYSYSIPYERVAKLCEKHPTRFSGLAGIDPTRGIEGLREFHRGITEYGFVGGHIYPHWFELPPDHAKFYPFYARCCELDVPVMMQVGHCLDYNRDRILKSVGRPLTLENIAIDFPELKIIGLHLGWPWTEEMIAMCFKHQNVFVCADAYAPKHWPENYVHYANSWGQDKVLFGSDWPVLEPERCVAEIISLGLRPEPMRKLLRDNALRVFTKLKGRVRSASRETVSAS